MIIPPLFFANFAFKKKHLRKIPFPKTRLKGKGISPIFYKDVHLEPSYSTK